MSFVNAAFNRDHTMVSGIVIFYACLIIFFNFATDIVQVWLNPKQKLE
jgi:oligopeptide transport system permease protein